VLEEYERHCGRRVLINTSFNLHDEPMVCRPEDAARTARTASIEVVQVGRIIASLG
jgi:carbamoyltransferase